MSPLRVEFESAKDQLRPRGQIEPGHAEAFMSAGEPKFLIFACDLYDQGGEIFGSDNLDSFAIVNHQLKIIDDQECRSLGRIKTGGDFSIAAKPEGQLGKYVLRHFID